VQTTVLKYLAIPYYLGGLYQRFPSNPNSQEDRQSYVQKSKACFTKFLSTVVRLQIVSEQLIKAQPQALSPEEQRNDKIKRYRREEQIKKQLNDLMQQRLKSLDEDEDSEMERKCVLLLLEQYAIKSVDALNSLNQEEQIISHMLAMIKEKGFVPPRAPQEPAEPAPKPIVIEDRRKVVAQNAFQPGWNLPTVSIEEANLVDYKEALKREKRQKESEKSNSIVAEYKEDQGEDVEDIHKQREFDAFKDDNPRGSGNTGTKGYKY